MKTPTAFALSLGLASLVSMVGCSKLLGINEASLDSGGSGGSRGGAGNSGGTSGAGGSLLVSGTAGQGLAQGGMGVGGAEPGVAGPGGVGGSNPQAVQKCQIETDCPSGLVCVSNICEQSCMFDSDCPVIGAGVSPKCITGTDSNGRNVDVCARICDLVLPARSAQIACPTGGFNCIKVSNVPASTMVITDCRLAGAGTEGQGCILSSDCSSGLYCTIGGQCLRHCGTAADCSANQACLELNPPVTVGQLKVGFCGSLCDPLSPQSPRNGSLSTCPANYGCYRSLTTNGTWTGAYCVQAGTLGVGESCAVDNNDCSPGLFCDASFLCRNFCSVNSECPPGATCRLFNPPTTIAGIPLGGCY